MKSCQTKIPNSYIIKFHQLHCIVMRLAGITIADIVEVVMLVDATTPDAYHILVPIDQQF